MFLGLFSIHPSLDQDSIPDDDDDDDNPAMLAVFVLPRKRLSPRHLTGTGAPGSGLSVLSFVTSLSSSLPRVQKAGQPQSEDTSPKPLPPVCG